MKDDFLKNGIELVFYEDIKLQDIPLPERGELLILNAETKASATALRTKMYTLGDDSGVFIEDLDYFPGVHSRRWMEGSDSERNEAILELMEGRKNRKCYLISEFALAAPDGKIIGNFRVKNEFTIATEEQGEFGFGYDPILIPDYINILIAGAKGKITIDRALEISKEKMTIGMLSQEEKNAINDRGKIAKDVYSKLVEKKIINDKEWRKKWER